MKTKQLTKTGQTIAILSLLIGTAIFVMYYLTSADLLLLIEHIFMVASAIINGLFLVLILLRYSKDKDNKFSLFLTAGIILLNVPVLLFYSWVTSLLIDIMRIRFVNATQETLTEIKITGCQNKKIQQLEAAKGQSVWIILHDDCEIEIEYIINGKAKKETVLKYATTSMGHKMKYKIGEKIE